MHQENEQSRRDVILEFYDENDNLVKNNQINYFNDNIILNVQSIEIKDEPSSNNHACNKEYTDKIITHENLITNTRNNDMKAKILTNVNFLQVNYDPQIKTHVVTRRYFDRMVDKNTILRLNDDSYERFWQTRVGKTAYNLQIYNKTQIIDVTVLVYPNTGHGLLYKWAIICNNKHGEGEPQDFLKSTKTNSPTSHSGATSLSPIGTAFMYVESSSDNHNTQNDDAFVSWQRTDIIHISNITLYYNRFSTTDAVKRKMGRLDIQILRNGSWETFYTIEKKN